MAKRISNRKTGKTAKEGKSDESVTRRLGAGRRESQTGEAALSQLPGAASAEPDTSEASFPVVGVGASAGGLEAFTLLLKTLPTDTGMAFVLVQHMDPTHESMLGNLLQKATAMPVREIAGGMAVRPNQVYVIPSNARLTISKGILELTSRVAGSAGHFPIDDFFRSLAQDLKSASIGVILSGTGSDGAHGLQAIKAAGGITFAQNPTSAKYPSMPLGAIATGSVDFTLPPEQIAAEIAGIGDHPYLRTVHREPAQLPGRTVNDMDEICSLLGTINGVDFHLYKPATISRRVARRMALMKLDTLGDYVRVLRQNRSELLSLYEDIFIHVTGFFRDPSALGVLKTIFSKMLSVKSASNGVRVWVPGCSSGEEVYSIAMLLFEQLGDANLARIQIFGSDISDRAIEQARAGIYAKPAMSGVSRERQQRFFRKMEKGSQIAQALRDVCVFARHDLAKDPPFSKLDLISCRNVLIYMRPPLQKRVIETFHYALKPDGYLLLGASESLSAYSNLFLIEDAKHKLFVRRPFVGISPLDRSAPGRSNTSSPQPGAVPIAPLYDPRKETERILLQDYAPAALVVDSRMHIIHFQGNISPFLSPSTGEPSFHLFRMVRSELVADLRAATHQARKRGANVRKEGIRLEQDGAWKGVDLAVMPLQRRHSEKSDLLVILQWAPIGNPQSKPAPSKASERDVSEPTSIERELASTQDQLRALVEDYQAADEEMRAIHEEVLSSNEELQSTNEELETAKEELQSSNEELTTLNDELRDRNAELSQLADDLSNLLVGVNIPIVILDGGLRIRRFTPVAAHTLKLLDTDIGRPFTDIATTLDVANWNALTSEVVHAKHVVEREVQDRQGRWYSLRMRPYTSGTGKVDGILMALLDIDAAKRSLDEARQARDFAEAIVETVREPLLVLDEKLRILKASHNFYETFQARPEHTEGRALFDLGDGQWDVPRLRELLEHILPDDSRLEGFEVEHEFPSIGYRSMVLNARQIRSRSSATLMILLAIEDVTELRRTQKQHALEEEQAVAARLAEARDNERREISRELHDDLTQRLGGLAIDLGKLVLEPQGPPSYLKKSLRSLQKRVVQAAEVTRNIANQLHPAELDDLGLIIALRSYCEDFSRKEGIAVRFTSRPLPAAQSRQIASCLYRVIQEGLRNVWKHAGVKRAWVTIEAIPDGIRLCVKDSGAGFSVGSVGNHAGLGIASMRERVRLLGGKFKIVSQPGQGTEITVELPSQEQTDEADPNSSR